MPPCARCWLGRWSTIRTLALRLAVALAPWWWLRGRLAGGSLTAWAALATLERHERFTDATPDERCLARSASRGPAAVGACPGTLGRPTRRRDEARHRRRVGLHAHHAQPAAISTRRRDWGISAPGNESWSPWSPRDAPTPRSLRSCTSACALSAPTWTVFRDKTGCRRRADLTRLALESGLV